MNYFWKDMMGKKPPHINNRTTCKKLFYTYSTITYTGSMYHNLSHRYVHAKLMREFLL